MSIIIGVGVTCLFVGTVIGFCTAALLSVGKQADEGIEEVWQ